MQTPYGLSDKTVNLARMAHQFGEIKSRSETKVGLSGFYNRYGTNETVSAMGEEKEDKRDLQKTSQRHCKRVLQKTQNSRGSVRETTKSSSGSTVRLASPSITGSNGSVVQLQALPAIGINKYFFL